MDEQSEKDAQPNDGRPFLAIAVRADNSISVNGSINDKVLAYGLLESARDAIKAHIEKQAIEKNIPEPHRIMEFLRRKR